MNEELPQETEDALEHFVCCLYYPAARACTVGELRQFLFKRKQAQSEGLPNTKAALHYTFLSGHFQAFIRNSDKMAIPHELDPVKYGWQMVYGLLAPVLTDQDPAPEAIVEIVKCSCMKTKCSTNKCKCKKHNLRCTDMCACSNDNEDCENSTQDDNPNGESDESDYGL